MAPGTKVLSSLPTDIDLPRIPVKVLQKRVVLRGVQSVPQVLVQWSEWPPEMATWEDADSVHQRFPCASAWGQAGFQQPGNVTSPEDQGVLGGPRRSSKPIKKNPHFSSSEWAV
jgi:hypothetical protein